MERLGRDNRQEIQSAPTYSKYTYNHPTYIFSCQAHIAIFSSIFSSICKDMDTPPHNTQIA